MNLPIYIPTYIQQKEKYFGYIDRYIGGFYGIGQALELLSEEKKCTGPTDKLNVECHDFIESLDNITIEVDYKKFPICGLYKNVKYPDLFDNVCHETIKKMHIYKGQLTRGYVKNKILMRVSKFQPQTVLRVLAEFDELLEQQSEYDNAGDSLDSYEMLGINYFKSLIETIEVEKTLNNKNNLDKIFRLLFTCYIIIYIDSHSEISHLLDLIRENFISESARSYMNSYILYSYAIYGMYYGFSSQTWYLTPKYKYPIDLNLQRIFS